MHVLHIALSRLFFPCNADLTKQPPREATPHNQCSELVDAYDILRARSLALQRADVHALWGGQHFGGKHKRQLTTDSPADWGSTLVLGSAGTEMRDRLERFWLKYSAAFRLPPLPTDRQWSFLAASVATLEHVDDAMNVLQEDHARAAQFIPLYWNLTMKFKPADADTAPLAMIQGGWLTELEGAVDRNLKVEFRADRKKLGKHDPFIKDNGLYSGFYAAGATTYMHVLQIAAICAVGPSADFGLSAFGEVSPRQMFERYCLYWFGKASGKDLDYPSDDTSAAPKPAAKPKDAKSKKARKTARMTNFRSELSCGTARLNADDARLADTQLLHRHWCNNVCRLGMCILNIARSGALWLFTYGCVLSQARAFFSSKVLPGASSGTSVCQWWGASGKHLYPHLEAGVRSLLSLGSGNAGIERVFGTTKSILTPQRLRSDLKTLFLKVNGAALDLPGYVSEVAAAECSDDEVGAASEIEVHKSDSEISLSEAEGLEGGAHAGALVDVDVPEFSCTFCGGKSHIVTSCHFLPSGFWSPAAETDRIRQAMFRSDLGNITGDAATVVGVSADGNCLFTSVAAELQRNGVIDASISLGALGPWCRSMFLDQAQRCRGFHAHRMPVSDPCRFRGGVRFELGRLFGSDGRR